MVMLVIGWLTNSDEIITAHVVSIVDGNTIQVKAKDNKLYRVLLYGVDCPELTQDYGMQAKNFLEKLVLRKEVTVQFHGKDRNGNLLAIVTTSDESDLRVELLKEGLAWISEKNSIPELEAYKTWAQKKEKGLWKEKDPTPPWVFRKQAAPAGKGG